jgi:zinc metalloprotease ZmpB
MYGKVKNRGTSAANNVTVRSYHSQPGAGLTWPNDFVEMSPVGGLTILSIGANNSQEITVGSFEWTPNINAYGHDCMLMIASVAGDPSNIDNFTGTETIAEWWLVPNDNNVGQRNVTIVPGGGGAEALTASLDGAFFIAGNSFNQS